MSQENVEIVQAAYRAINSGDTERLLDLAANDVEVQASGLMLDQGTYHGHEGAMAYGDGVDRGATVSASYEEMYMRGGCNPVATTATALAGHTRKRLSRAA